MNQQWDQYFGQAIKPQGWLHRQLEIQAEGLSGNLDKMWPPVRDSAWIGGASDGWELVPYWLDGFIPLAYLLDDEDKKVRAKKYIDAILASQRRDGWICPCKTREIPKYDTWAVQLLSKTLLGYYRCSGDERIPSVLYDMMKNYYNLLKDGTVHLFEWGKSRWFEACIAISFLYEKYHEEWLLELTKILREQGTDYRLHTSKWERPLNIWRQETHIVNLTMMLKSECVSCDLLGEEYEDLASRLFDILDKYNGTAVGTFTGDECLSGTSPIQGTELCSVAELMYSLEWLYAYTGDAKWAERLEKIAFNALPAPFTDDMWTHQYDQMVNQINCMRFWGKPVFRTNGDMSHLFGLMPQCGCCTGNFNQAWPKLTQNVFLHNGNTICNALLLPATLCADGIQIELQTQYPFENTFKYRIKTEKDFNLQIRIPSFAENLTIDGKSVKVENGIVSLQFCAGDAKEISMAFETTAHLCERPNSMTTVECGSLVYALPIKYEKKMFEYTEGGIERKFPYCDYELKGKSEWRYGLCETDEKPAFSKLGDTPFSSQEPPLTLRAKCRRIDWDYEDGYYTVCSKVPDDTSPVDEPEELLLVPYGCTKLRITEMPLLKI